MPRLMLPALLLAVSGCAAPASRLPPRADLQAAVEAKPVPTAEIVTSSKAAADYDAAIEAWGDRVRAAGGRLCRYFRALGMAIDCPGPER